MRTILKELGCEIQVMAVDMSYRLGWIDDSIVKRVHRILQEAKLPTSPPETMTVEMFKSVMAVRLLGCLVIKSYLLVCLFNVSYIFP